MKKLFLFLVILSCTKPQPDLEFPETPRGNHIDTLFDGTLVSDPYRWMEDLESVKLKSFAQTQDSLFNVYVQDDPLYHSLRNEIKQHAIYDRFVFPNALILPFETPTGIYYPIQPGGSEEIQIYHKRDITSEGRVLIENTDVPQGHVLSGFDVDDRGRFLTIAHGMPGSNWVEIKVKDLLSNEFLRDELNGIYGNPKLCWESSGNGFYYVRHRQPGDHGDPNMKIENGEIYYHQIGTSQNLDRHIQTLDGLSASLLLFEGESTLLIKSSKTFVVDLKSMTRHQVVFESETSYRFLDIIGDRFVYLTTRDDGSGCRLVSMDWKDPGRFRTIIDHLEMGIRDPVIIQGSYLMARVSNDGFQNLRIFSLTDEKERGEVEIPFMGSIYRIASSTSERPFAYFSLINLTNPLTIMRVDLSTGASEQFLTPKSSANFTDFVTERHSYPAKDGTQIPMLLTYKKGMIRDGSNPLILYAYGALGSPMVDYYQEEMMTWINRGGIYANAGVRGGGDYGVEWARAGRGINKQTGIDDYLSAGKWLIENDYTSAQHLIAYGGSLSGVLPAAAITQEPSLFGAAMIRIPIIDMLRFPRFGYAGNWRKEFGDPDNPDEVRQILEYSPYHNIDPARTYPPCIIQVGEKDQTATPVHGYKLAAALQYANRGDSNPVFLQVGWGAGHAIGKDLHASTDAKAKALAFLLYMVD